MPLVVVVLSLFVQDVDAAIISDATIEVLRKINDLLIVLYVKKIMLN